MPLLWEGYIDWDVYQSNRTMIAHTQVEFQKMALVGIGMSPTMISWRSFACWRASNQTRGSPRS
jgi:hypothetical protein